MKRIVLTRDMVPIHYTDSPVASSNFICPLPKGYKKAIEEMGLVELDNHIATIVRLVNVLAQRKDAPFENILIEYQDRTPKQQEELLKGFKIERIGIDSRGLYSVLAGGSINSGDIYLATEQHPSYDFDIDGFEEYFEPETAFCCHNVDFYWQALLTREVVVRYFNLLNSKL